MSEYKIRNICCIGAGYVGGPTMAVFAEHCKELKFVVSDINDLRIKLWNNKDISNTLTEFELISTPKSVFLGFLKLNTLTSEHFIR